MPKFSRKALLAALAVVCCGAAQAGGVDEVVKAGVLKVCTPGDYKPFSFALPDGSFEGLDVDLVTSLATSLGVKAQFVKTTWAKMMDDFTGGACDIAVGVISVTLERQ